MKPRSLRLRLVISTATSLTVIFVIAAAALYLLMRASLVREFDNALASEAAAVAALTEQDKGSIDVELQPGDLPQFSQAQRPHYFEMWFGGRSVARSESLADGHLDKPEPPGEPTYDSVTLPDGRAGRAVCIMFAVRDETLDPGVPRPALMLVVARDTLDLKATLARLRGSLAAVGLATVFAGAATMAWVIGRGLRPLASVAQSIERVGVTDLSERLSPNGTPREIVPVVQRLNELLTRLEAVVARERSFTADVAHELRTPLAGLSAALEVSASRPRDPASYQEVTGKCLRVTRGMQTMVDNLLLLARADSRQLASNMQNVEIGPLLRECWEIQQAQARERSLEVTWNIGSQTAGVRSDPELLRMIVNNLFTNAVTYADAGGAVQITFSTIEGRAEITVSNTGSRVSTSDAEHVFDRFWRGDAARTEAGIRCGLGLSLCRKLVEVLGGTIAATSENEMFRVTVSLPAEASTSRV